MTATRRPAPESTTSTPAPDTLWSTTFDALSPLRRDAVASYLRREPLARAARRLGRTERDVLALRDSSLACWGALAASSGPGVAGRAGRLGQGAAALTRRDRRILARALPPAPAAAPGPVVGRRRGVLVAVMVSGAVSLVGVTAAVVVHEGPGETPPADAAGVPSPTGTAATGDPAPPASADPVAMPDPVLAGGLLVPAARSGRGPGAGPRADAVPVPAPSTDPDEDASGEPGDPGTPAEGGPGVSVETDPASGRVRIVLRLPGAEPIVIETPTRRG